MTIGQLVEQLEAHGMNPEDIAIFIEDHSPNVELIDNELVVTPAQAA